MACEKLMAGRSCVLRQVVVEEKEKEEAVEDVQVLGGDGERTYGACLSQARQLAEFSIWVANSLIGNAPVPCGRGGIFALAIGKLRGTWYI
jgi:trans-2-enoyl-CoA reductase